MEDYKVKIIDIVKETSETYSVKFEIPEGFAWKAGQFSNWKFLDGDEIRIFSIASIEEEGYLMFTTRIAKEHSDWKEILLEKKVGDYMTTSPAKGRFAIGKDRSLAIAGGVGIAPIRALAVEKPDTKLTIFYLESCKEYCYKEEFDKMENIEIIYLNNREELYTEIEKYVEEYQNTSEYLVAGSPGMNKGISNRLKEMGIEKKNIKMDNFIGYF